MSRNKVYHTTQKSSLSSVLTDGLDKSSTPYSFQGVYITESLPSCRIWAEQLEMERQQNFVIVEITLLDDDTYAPDPNAEMLGEAFSDGWILKTSENTIRPERISVVEEI